MTLCDPLGARCTAPREDRHTALCLLLELGVQKGTLAATLEAIVLLLTLWEKANESDDNRDIPQNKGAPLIPILKRYESIGSCGSGGNDAANNIGSNATEVNSSLSATDCFLRFLTLPENETSNVDLKQGAVVIISYIDRLAKHHMPCNAICAPLNSHNLNNKKIPLPHLLQAQNSQDSGGSISISTPSAQLNEQRIYAMGWPTLCREQHGFTSLPTLEMSYSNGQAATSSNLNMQNFAPVLNFCFQVKQVVFSEEYVLFLTQEGKMYTWRISKPETEPMNIEDMTDIVIVTVTTHIEGKHYLAVDNMGRY